MEIFVSYFIDNHVRLTEILGLTFGHGYSEWAH